MPSSQNSEQDVSKLRELLFGKEKRVLSDIEQLVLKHEERIGNDESMQQSVADIIADALQEAEVRDHRKLANAISPVVIQGIKREIKNSRDEMVDAFYPILGRLVSAYVSHAFKDFVEETNRRLEGSLTGRFIRLRIKSLFSGVPYHQLVLREARRLKIEELFLIRKGSGILIDRWEADPGSGTGQDEQLLSSMLTAMNEFANEAFANGTEELRAMDVGASRIFLRATSTCLLAVKSTGYSGRKIEHLLDREMISILESYSEALEQSDTQTAQKSIKAILPHFAEQVNVLLSRHRKPPVLAYTFLTLLLLGGISVSGWFAWEHIQTQRIESKIATVIASHPELNGYPINVNVSSDRTRVLVSGLSPDRALSKKLISDVEQELGSITVDGRFAFVTSAENFGNEVKRVDASVQEVTEKQVLDGKRVTALTNEFERLNTFALSSKRELQTVGGTVQRLVDRLDHPRRKVQEWARSHAIFFGDGDKIRDPELVSKLLKEFSSLLMASKARVRVIGYTDPTGPSAGNVSLAVKRANKVAKELLSYGVTSDRLKVLGRPRGLLLSYDKGPLSSNRRVEFELIYEEEAVVATGEPLDEPKDVQEEE